MNPEKNTPLYLFYVLKPKKNIKKSGIASQKHKTNKIIAFKKYIKVSTI